MQGAERTVRVPSELERFRELPMLVSASHIDTFLKAFDSSWLKAMDSVYMTAT